MEDIDTPLEGEPVIEEINTGSDSKSSLKETATTIGGCLTYLAFTLGGLVLLVMLFKGTPWIAENIYPWVMRVTGWAIFIIIPISLILAIFRKTRGIAGVGLFGSSYIIGISLWVWSLIIAYVLAGVVWMLIGIVFGGLGVVPVAFVAALLSGEWSTAIQVLVIAVVMFAIRAFGLFLTEKYE